MVDFIQLLCISLAIAISFAGAGFQNSKFIPRLKEVGAKTGLVSLCIGIATFLGGLAIAGILHEPVARVHDEFSYVLMSNTFAAGHVSNPAPPLPEFFETFHELVRPVYVSKYFPVQGIYLAVGEKLTNHAAVGVWLSAALACVATCWMLQAWVGPVWAMLGATLMVLQYGVLSYWSQSYWGGMAAALGGALFFGAARRLWDRFYWPTAIWLALGAVILVNSRPFEGILATLPTCCAFVWRIWKRKNWKESAFWKGMVFPAGAVLLLGAAATCSYNKATTGSPWKSPYMLHEEQYQESPPLIFLSPHPRLSFSSETLRIYYEVREYGLWARQRNLPNFMRTITGKLYTWWVFFCGVLLTPPLVLPGLLKRGRLRYLQIGFVIGFIVLSALSNPDSIPLRSMIDILVLAQIGLMWLVFDEFWERIALVTCVLLIFAMFISKWAFPHYYAPAACSVLFLQVSGLKRLWHWRIQQANRQVQLSRAQRRRAAKQVEGKNWVSPRRGFVTLLPIVCLISLLVRVEARSDGGGDVHGLITDSIPARGEWSLRRAELEQWLQQQPKPQLVFVRYHPRHNVKIEWVWNKPDIIHSKVIWARDLGAEHNRLLLAQFRDRTVWSIEADRLVPQLVPYSEDIARAPAHLEMQTNADGVQTLREPEE